MVFRWSPIRTVNGRLLCRSAAGEDQWFSWAAEFRAGRRAGRFARRLRIELSFGIRPGEEPGESEMRDWIQRPHHIADFSVATVQLDHVLRPHGSRWAQRGSG